MGGKRKSSRDKIIEAAVELFTQQGTAATTTKEIAERAAVNEVTLFRQFGSKQGLLLSIVSESHIAESLQVALSSLEETEDAIVAYSRLSLDLLGSVPELVRSLIGESRQASPEMLRAVGDVLQQANWQTVQYLQSRRVELPNGLSTETAASLINTLILGRMVTQIASEGHGLWQEADFLSAIRQVFDNQVAARETVTDFFTLETSDDPGLLVQDLPAETVSELFQKAKKIGPQAYALAYVMFGAGLTIEEAATLRKSQSLSSKQQHILVVAGQLPRQVPLNRWIMGDRYGSYLKNPLTQWLKNRQDETPEIFVDENKAALGEKGLVTLWNAIAADSITAMGNRPTPFNARQTWCIELLMKGMSLENLSILSGFSLEALDQYARRAKEKVALQAAIAIDQKS